MSWVVDMEKKLDDAEQPDKVERWPRHCIFRVPLRFKKVDGSVYKPQTVSLGPFHHDDVELKPMEMHKLRAVRHLVRRDSCKTTLVELVAAVDEVADELEDSYMDLGDEWRGEENRGKFLEMMITDGCFLLEVMRGAATIGKKDSIPTGDYAHGDPIFSRHGIQHIKPFVQRDMLLVENQLPLSLLEKIVTAESGTSPVCRLLIDPVFSWDGIQQIKPFVQRDMLMVENQLPLRLLERIVAAEDGTSPSAASINSMVLKFLEREDAPEETVLGLHPLDIYRTSRLKRKSQRNSNRKVLHRGMPTTPTTKEVNIVRLGRAVPRSAWTLYKAGIRFLPSGTSCLDDIDLDNGRLYMPMVLLDDSTIYRVLNMMAFEAIHVGTRDDMTAYVLFVKDFIDSAHDVRLLARKGILGHNLVDDDAVVRLFNRLTTDVSQNWERQLSHVRTAVEHHYCCNRHRNRVHVFLYESWANLRSKYLTSPWTLLGLLTATLLLVADIVQAVYAVKSYYEPDKGN